MDNNNNDNSINDQPLFPFLQNREQIRSFKRTIPVSVYDFYIIDEIKEPDAYIELIHTLKNADPQDTIFIYLNTVGGSLYTTIQILSAMNSSQAKIVTSLEGQACSAGTFIFLKGDTKIVNRNCAFMVHSYSQSTSGKGNEIVEQINFMEAFFKEMASDIYSKFLTKDELERVYKGHDIWLTSQDVVDRLELHGHDYIYTQNRDELEVEINLNVNDTEEEESEKKPITEKKSVKRRATKKKVGKKKASE